MELYFFKLNQDNYIIYKKNLLKQIYQEINSDILSKD